MNGSAYGRLAAVADELFGEEMDLESQHRFSGDKTQWNHHIPSNLIGFVNDVLFVSPRWNGRGGKAGFTAHALYLAARIELALLNDPPERVVLELEKLVAMAKSDGVVNGMVADRQTIKLLDKEYQDTTLDGLPALLDTVTRIEQTTHSTACRDQARRLRLDITDKLNNG